MKKAKIIIITGPTATGKSALAVECALRFDGELINADSMQVYRRMDIGTAKPSKAELLVVPHHLIDICEPDEDYTAARFEHDAARKINEIRSRGKNVFVVGGTGLYIKALTKGLFKGPAGDRALRDELFLMAEESGAEIVHERLEGLDPVAAAAIHPNNLRRVVRAIEITMLMGRPASEVRGDHGFSGEPYNVLKLGIRMERAALYAAVEDRVDRMIGAGLAEEVKGLMTAGYGADLKPMAGLGYKEMTGYLKGAYTIDEAVALIKMNTRRYAKRQITWFKKDTEIRWFLTGEKDAIMDAVKEFLQS